MDIKLFIPIKAHSQRVPEKNFRKLGKHKLYERCLLKFRKFRVYVDTDSDEIIDAVKNDRRFVHVCAFNRNEELRGDEVSVNKLIRNFVSNYCARDDVVGQIHVTNPFLRPQTVNEAFEQIEKEGYDSVAGCNLINSRLWREEEHGFCPVNHNPLKLEQTQDLTTIYEENSTFYIFRVESFLLLDNRISRNPGFFQVNYPETIDIDTEDDWDNCVEVFKRRKKWLTDTT